jgi:hypothetical protein
MADKLKPPWLPVKRRPESNRYCVFCTVSLHAVQDLASTDEQDVSIF